MIRTALFLLTTLLIVPLLIFTSGYNITDEQYKILIQGAKIMAIISLACFIISELAKNYSQTDKIWSLAPILYAWYFSSKGGFDQRTVLMAILVTIWGIRLTYNFARRGGYNILFWKGEEDYRWAVLREMPFLKGRFRWGLFNLIFISFYQNTLILLFTIPTVAALNNTNKSLNWLDVVATILILGFIVIETVADQQQYNYQTEKHRKIKSGEPLDDDQILGFLNKGLWGLVRHPNYAAEQAFWISYYLFSVAATGKWFNWSIAGAILLVLLFLGSSTFSEKISAGKYPEYYNYQKTVPRFVPWTIWKSKNQ
jgi:steroid 5-alpha reductase family enzyme